MDDKGLHGVITDSPILRAVLDLGNQIRYGKTEAERQADVQGLRTPGVRDAAFTGPLKTFDPAAAERYTSAYQFGQRFAPPSWLLPALHAISSGGRKAMSAVGVPGVMEERPDLVRAEEMGMERGTGTPDAQSKRLAAMAFIARSGR